MVTMIYVQDSIELYTAKIELLPLSILHSHFLHSYNLFLSCGHRTAVMIKIFRIYMALQFTRGRSLLKEQCHFWCVAQHM